MDRHRCAECRFLWERVADSMSRCGDSPRCRNLACKDGGEVVDANVERECKHFRVKGE